MFPRFTGTSTSYSYTINNETFKKLFQGKEDKKNNVSETAQNSTQTNETGAEVDDIENSLTPTTDSNEKKSTVGEDGYEKITVPWSISASYSVRYGNTVFNKNKMEYDMGFTHNLSFNGNLTLTQKWNITGNATYDFKDKQITYFGINVNRNLHCWNMSASIVPFGAYKSYSFHIGVNASMLSDLKYDKQSEYGRNNINWY